MSVLFTVELQNIIEIFVYIIILPRLIQIIVKLIESEPNQDHLFMQYDNKWGAFHVTNSTGDVEPSVLTVEVYGNYRISTINRLQMK
ncbi:hypothetical protein DYG62_01305 [Yersinia enterocolitica]|nr:hypothetical protein [Yersinia enterocolitica]